MTCGCFCLNEIFTCLTSAKIDARCRIGAAVTRTVVCLRHWKRHSFFYFWVHRILCPSSNVCFKVVLIAANGARFHVERVFLFARQIGPRAHYVFSLLNSGGVNMKRRIFVRRVKTNNNCEPLFQTNLAGFFSRGMFSGFASFQVRYRFIDLFVGITKTEYVAKTF